MARRALPAVLLAVLAALLLAWPAQGRAQEPPTYRIHAEVDVTAHTIRGTLELELDAADPRLGETLWFHLPPNRFLAEDPRGQRRVLESLTFASRFRSTSPFDPVWPDGFSAGGLDVDAVEASDGTALPFTLAPNPRIPVGYSVRDGLLRVTMPKAGAGTIVRIRFVTRLPHRHWEGWSDAGILAEEWYPILANRGAEGWDFDVDAPRAGRYEARVSVSAPGQLFLGHGWTTQVTPAAPIHMPLDPHPLRAFALVFLAEQTLLVRHDYEVSLYVYHQAEHGRLGQLAARVAHQFLGFVREEYGLPAPDTRIAIVEVDVPPGDIRTVGSLLLVPRDYFQSSALLDRIFVAQLSRALAQVWFGETVWSNRDRESWLHLGLPGYLALEFFHSLFGWDAGVHDIIDWLQPRYREHFFEAPVRDLMRQHRDAPVLLSLQGHPAQRAAIIVAHNKAPIVLRSLYYVVGHDAFVRGLNALYLQHRYGIVTERTLEQVMSASAGQPLAPFFKQWFQGVPDVNFAIERWAEAPVAEGYRVDVDVKRTDLPMLPVDVEVRTTDGNSFVQRWEPGATRARLSFQTRAPVRSVVVDPEEYWLEVDRKDNYSATLYRVRPFYDWPKQRELLVAFRAQGGGNSIDGNYIGIGVNLTLNENNTLSVIPIYGERTGLTNYELTWRWLQLFVPELHFNLTLEKLGGATRQSVGFAYQLLNTDHILVQPELDLNAETVTDADYVDDDGSFVFQPRSRVNNLGLALSINWTPRTEYSNSTRLAFRSSQPSYRSEYDYTSQSIEMIQTLALGSSHLLRLELTRAGTIGAPPLQKRYTLGGPELLRGYPRTLALSYDEIAAATLDYGWVASRAITGTTAQVRRITLYLFGDVGRGWNNGEVLDSRPQRQDAGVGMEMLVNVLRLAELPLRLDVAWPLSDERYKDPQLILFGLLNF